MVNYIKNELKNIRYDFKNKFSEYSSELYNIQNIVPEQIDEDGFYKFEKQLSENELQFSNQCGKRLNDLLYGQYLLRLINNVARYDFFKENSFNLKRPYKIIDSNKSFAVTCKHCKKKFKPDLKEFIKYLEEEMAENFFYGRAIELTDIGIIKLNYNVDHLTSSLYTPSSYIRGNGANHIFRMKKSTKKNSLSAIANNDFLTCENEDDLQFILNYNVSHLFKNSNKHFLQNQEIRAKFRSVICNIIRDSVKELYPMNKYDTIIKILKNVYSVNNDVVIDNVFQQSVKSFCIMTGLHNIEDKVQQRVFNIMKNKLDVSQNDIDNLNNSLFMNEEND